jgi:GAF domain-containing protein
VHGEYDLQFYAVTPLRTPNGFNIGVIAIADKEQHDFSDEDKKMPDLIEVC